MLVCKKCNIEKPLDEYETYFHRPQGKMRMRKYCKDCFREQKRLWRESIKENKITQPVSPEPPTIDFSTNPDYYKCKMCEEWKVMKKDFYLHKGGNPLNGRCKVCQKILDRKEADEHKKENGGNLKVKQKPNQYMDEYQKENTFLLMGIMGYLFDEGTGIWYKPGVKEIVNGKPVFLKVKKRKKSYKPRFMNQELLMKILELRKRKLTYAQIAIKFNLSDTTIRKYVTDYEKSNKTCKGGGIGNTN